MENPVVELNERGLGLDMLYAVPKNVVLVPVCGFGIRVTEVLQLEAPRGSAPGPL